MIHGIMCFETCLHKQGDPQAFCFRATLKMARSSADVSRNSRMDAFSKTMSRALSMVSAGSSAKKSKRRLSTRDASLTAITILNLAMSVLSWKFRFGQSVETTCARVLRCSMRLFLRGTPRSIGCAQREKSEKGSEIKTCRAEGAAGLRY